jgi:hypothetical protein
LRKLSVKSSRPEPNDTLYTRVQVTFYSGFGKDTDIGDINLACLLSSHAYIKLSVGTIPRKKE